MYVLYFKDSLNYLERNTKVIDPATQKAFYYYETLHLGKNRKDWTSMNSKEIARIACEAMEDKKHRTLRLSILKMYLHWQITSSLQAE